MANQLKANGYQPIHEPITAKIEFGLMAKPRITQFTWHGKEHIVTNTTMQLKARHGRDLVWLFCVATATAAFKLRFDTDTLKWWLEEYTWDLDTQPT